MLRDRPVFFGIASGGVFTGERANQPDFLRPRRDRPDGRGKGPMSGDCGRRVRHQIVVIGGTGLIDSKTVAILRRGSH